MEREALAERERLWPGLAFFDARRWDDERTRELEAHLAIETDENIARGLTPDAAVLAARQQAGQRVTRIREDIHDMNSVSVLETAATGCSRRVCGNFAGVRSSQSSDVCCSRLDWARRRRPSASRMASSAGRRRI